MMNDAIYKNIIFLLMRLKYIEFSPVVLSVIAAEMYFRGSLHRFIEYCAWMALWCVRTKRVETLTVGVAQLQLNKWREFGYISSFSPSLSNIMSVLCVENNYEACERYLSHTARAKQINHIELSRLYTGRARVFHTKVIKLAFNIATEIAIKTKYNRCLTGMELKTVARNYFR